MLTIADMMAYAEAFESLPDGSVLEKVGGTFEGIDGTWVAGAFRVGPRHWYAAMVPTHDQSGTAVAWAMPFTDIEFAAIRADVLAKIAAG